MTTSWKSKPNFAKAGSKIKGASTGTHAHSPTASTSYRRRSTCPPDTRRSSASSTMRTSTAPTERGASSSIPWPWPTSCRSSRTTETSPSTWATDRSSKRTLIAWCRDWSVPKTRFWTNSTWFTKISSRGCLYSNQLLKSLIKRSKSIMRKKCKVKITKHMTKTIRQKSEIIPLFTSSNKMATTPWALSIRPTTWSIKETSKQWSNMPEVPNTTASIMKFNSKEEWFSQIPSIFRTMFNIKPFHNFSRLQLRTTTSKWFFTHRTR